MDFDYEFYIVDKRAVPDSLIKAHKVKMLLENNEKMSVSDAVKKVGISRSAFYKYKDMIMPYIPLKRDKVVTLYMRLSDAAGSLSTVLGVVAKQGANVLTINQNIPINGNADISLSIDTSNMKKDMKYLEKKIKSIENVSNFSAVGNDI